MSEQSLHACLVNKLLSILLQTLGGMGPFDSNAVRHTVDSIAPNMSSFLQGIFLVPI